MYVYVYVCRRESGDLHVGVDKVRASLPLASRVSLLSFPLASRVSLLSLPLASRVSICVCVWERERGFACWS